MTKDPEMQLMVINAVRVYVQHQAALRSKQGPFGNKPNVAAAESPRPLAKLFEKVSNLKEQ